MLYHHPYPRKPGEPWEEGYLIEETFATFPSRLCVALDANSPASFALPPVSFVLLLASFCPLLLSPVANASLTLLPLAIAEVGRVTDPMSLSVGELVGLAKAVMEAEVEGEVDGVQVEEEHQL